MASKTLRKSVRQNTVHIHTASTFTGSEASLITSELFFFFFLLSLLHHDYVTHEIPFPFPSTIKPNRVLFQTARRIWGTNKTLYEKATWRSFTAEPSMRKFINISLFLEKKRLLNQLRPFGQKTKNAAAHDGLRPCDLFGSPLQSSGRHVLQTICFLSSKTWV